MELKCSTERQAHRPILPLFSSTGFPSSSHQLRSLIPTIASKYHVLAPDPPGSGFTSVPVKRGYEYTLTSLTSAVEKFLDALPIVRFAVYVF